MSHSVIVPPVHDTLPPPLDDENDDNDDDDNNFIRQSLPSIQPDEESIRENSPTNDNENNDEWQSVDENQENPVASLQDDEPTVEEPPKTEENGSGWANFASFEPKVEESTESETPVIESTKDDDDNWAFFESPTVPSADSAPVVSSSPPPPAEEQVTEEKIKDDDDNWAFFESPMVPSNDPEPVISSSSPPPVEEKVTDDKTKEDDDDDDDFGEFSEVQVSSDPSLPMPPPPPPPAPPSSVQTQAASLPIENLSSEKIESLMSACFPIDPSVSSSMSNHPSHFPQLPSFITLKTEEKQIDYLESSLSLWKVLSNLATDPVGVTFQWRKSNTERLFHQSLGVSERFRAKTVPLTPEVLQPEKVKLNASTSKNDSEQNDQEAKDHLVQISSPTVRPHFDWKQSGLENPLADNDSSSLSSNLSKNEEISNVFDANKTLDLDFYVPPVKPTEQESERTASPSSNQSPIVPTTQRASIPIKTMDLFPGSTTTLNDDAKRILDSLPNLSFMSAKALMFPVRFNGSNHDESTSFY